jgi:hypothetical protein
MKLATYSTGVLLALALAGCGGGDGDSVAFSHTQAAVATPEIPTSRPAPPVVMPEPTIPTPTGVVFFRDDAPSGGDGSSTNPFSSLAQAVASAGSGEAVFIYAGSGNPIEFNGSLPPNTILIGEGAGFTQGDFSVPAGTFPTLRGRIILRAGSALQGLRFENPTGDALQAGALAGLILDNNRFSNISGAAVKLDRVTGEVRISNNRFADDSTLDPSDGVSVQLTQSDSLVLTFRDNVFTTPDRSAAFDYGLRGLGEDSSSLNVSAQRNELDNQANGLSFQFSGDSDITAQIFTNSFTGSLLEGLSLQSGLSNGDSVSSDFTATGNTFSNTLGPGIQVRARGDGNGEHDWSLFENTITAAGNFGILCVRGDSASVRTEITDNTIAGAAQAGIQYTSGTASGGFTVPLLGEDRLIIDGNQISGSPIDGINLNLISAIQATLLLNNTSSRPFQVLSRGLDACFGAGDNNANGDFSVTVDNGFSLVFDDRGQVSPTVTFQGGGNVSPGDCNP